MSFLDIVRARNGIQGNNYGQSVKNTSLNKIERLFRDSPNYRVVKIDDIDTEVIIDKGKTSEDKKLLLKPNTTINKGSVVIFDSKSHLMIEVNSDVNNIYPAATIQLCNSTIQLSGTQTVTVIDDPLWGKTEQITYSDPIAIPCIVETSVRTDNTDEAINLPMGQVIITIKYMEHEELDIDKQLTVFGDNYKINGFDKSKQGLLIIYGEKV